MSVLRIYSDEDVRVLVITRPDARNAVNDAVTRALEDALTDIEGDDSCRAAVITGAEPMFCSGADLKLIAAGRRAELYTALGGFAGVVRRRRRKPLVAAVNGAALGGGAEIALACDLIVASEDALFGFPEATHGFVPGGGGLFRLPRTVPRNVAVELCLTGDVLTAARAYELGFVNRLVTAGGLIDSAVELARKAAGRSQVATGEIIGSISSAMFPDEVEQWRRTDEALAAVEASGAFRGSSES